MLLKKHEEFEGTSSAHDDRIRSLSEQANKLIHAGHYDTARYSMEENVHMYDVYSLPFLPLPLPLPLPLSLSLPLSLHVNFLPPTLSLQDC